MHMAKGRNVLIAQSGGCTAVMNGSLVGVVEEVLEHRDFDKVYGAVHGLAGILEGRLLDITMLAPWVRVRIAGTPGAVLGSGRRSLRPEEMPRVLEVLDKHQIGYFFAIGGNDSAETAHLMAVGAKDMGLDLAVMHVPKTIDNDLVFTDHTPGYGSAGRFVALATMGVGRDAEAMGDASPVTILEVMGRDAGWLAASACLAKREEMDAPHYICLPEVTLDENRFLAGMEEAYRRWGFAVAVTAENVEGPSGPLGRQQEPYFVDDFGHRYFDGAGRYLAQLVTSHLKVRVRFEKPGTIQRSLMACVSDTDAQEANLVGQAAVRYAIEGHSDSMVSLVRLPGRKYQCDTGLAPLGEVAGKVRAMPPEYLGDSAGQVTREYLEYASPLIGEPLPSYARLITPGMSWPSPKGLPPL